MTSPDKRQTADDCSGNPSDVTVDRRTYLSLATVSLSTAGIVGTSTESATAATTGFGADGYGFGGYGDSSTDGGLTVNTGGASEVADSEVTLNGELTDLGDTGVADVYFELRSSGSSSWAATPADSRSSIGTFNEKVTGLNAETTYEIRAVAEGSDGERSQGSVRTFTTTGPVAVATGSAMDVDRTSATLAGDLTDLGGATSVTVSFEWGPADGGLAEATETETLSSTGAFAQKITGLDSGSEYAFRAVAEASDGDTAVGATHTVTTDEAASPPTIERFGVSEAGKPDPHATISVNWRVSDGDGDLRRVSVEIDDPDGVPVDSASRTVDGASASGSERFTIKHGGDTVYDVAFRVVDGAGNVSHQTTSVRA